ncbi:DUF1801 domain-containing protein [Kibdelosporangium phytohabitans]|uniref:YdhG-like domain-containing protein n=1 Tax=Kibdelosporangium phytohabitans TaxID=860235 RepID=A0A0N9I040_9PSEU|nr:DUF1801 domain-containing protein [Kibdelosporangium phytohabitans]ALG07860.1 hypothetical protein AOZ06_13890 [Kibdelosporangium phytohabitans]MBE1471214.1 hypothetical protein [Kibdelosporangium phytohabitans]
MGDVDKILEKGGALTRQVHELLLELFPDAVLTADDENIGYGTTTGYKGLKFTVAPFSGYVRLGIAGGAALDDPANLMQGTGKVHRHLKVRSAGQLADPALRDLLAAALE